MEPMMNSPRRNILIGVFVAALVVGGGVWWYTHQQTPPFELVAGEAVTSWDFTGSYKDGGSLEKKANDEIIRLEALLGNKEGEPTDYNLYVSIANQYALLGDGKTAYEYLNKALAIDSKTTGLAWYNVASLLERLGARESARVAYTNAVDAQPQVEQYHTARLQFLINNFSGDAAVIEADFAQAEAQFGNLPSILQIKAPWLTKEKRFEEAIEAWTSLQAQMPQRDPSIDKEITRLRGEL